MKKKMLIVAMGMVLLAAMPKAAQAYISKGTVEIEADTEEITIAPGETKKIPVHLTPQEDEQFPGCGMADCPETCGDCLTKNMECPCDGTEYETYYAQVKVRSSDEGVAAAQYEEGYVEFQGISQGEAQVKASAALRNFTGSSVTFQVHVKEGDPEALDLQEQEAGETPVEKVSMDAYTGEDGNQYLEVRFLYESLSDDWKAFQDSLKIVLAGTVVKAEDYTLEQTGEKELLLTMKMEALRNGILKITSKEETILEALVPTGVTLTEEGDGVYKVASLWKVRGITWIQLLENGAVVEPKEAFNVLDGAIPVHGHDYQEMTEEDTAEKIVQALEEYFGDTYQFEQEGPKIILKKSGSEPASKLELKIYTYGNVKDNHVES